MCNCFQNIKLLFKESNQSIHFRVPLPLGSFCVGHSFPSKRSCHPVLGQAPPQSWARVRVQMAQSRPNSQPAPPAPVPMRAFGIVLDSSAALHRAPAGSTTAPAFRSLCARLPIPHQILPAACYSHSCTQAKPRPGPDQREQYRYSEPLSHSTHYYTDSEDKNKSMVPTPWVLVPHTKKDAPKQKEPRTARELWTPAAAQGVYLWQF